MRLRERQYAKLEYRLLKIYFKLITDGDYCKIPSSYLYTCIDEPDFL